MPTSVRDVIGEIEGLGGTVERDADDRPPDHQSRVHGLARPRPLPDHGCRLTALADPLRRQPLSRHHRRGAHGGRQPDVLDYYLLPQIDLGPARLRLADDNGLGLDCFRFASLDYFFGMAERAPSLPVAA